MVIMRRAWALSLGVLLILSAPLVNPAEAFFHNQQPEKEDPGNQCSEYQDETGDTPTLIPAKKGKNWGYIDRSGTWVIDPKFAHASPFKEDIARVIIGVGKYNRETKYGYIDRDGDFVIRPDYSWLGQNSGGIIPSLKETTDGRYEFYKDPTEAFIPRMDVSSVEPHQYTFRYIGVDGQPYFTPPLEKKFTSIRIIGISHFQAGCARIRYPGRNVLINRQGQTVVAPVRVEGEFTSERTIRPMHTRLDPAIPNFYYIEDFQNGLAPAIGVMVKEGRYQEREVRGYLNRSGDWALQLPGAEDHQAFSEGKAAVKMDGKWGYIDRSGTWVIEPHFLDARAFSDGLAPVRQETLVETEDGGLKEMKRWGFINVEGEAAIDWQFHQALPFSEGLAAVAVAVPDEHEYDWGYIDRDGNYVIEPQYRSYKKEEDSVESFHHGLASVKDRNEGIHALGEKIINREGEVVYQEKKSAHY